MWCLFVWLSFLRRVIVDPVLMSCAISPLINLESYSHAYGTLSLVAGLRIWPARAQVSASPHSSGVLQYEWVEPYWVLHHSNIQYASFLLAACTVRVYVVASRGPRASRRVASLIPFPSAYRRLIRSPARRPPRAPTTDECLSRSYLSSTHRSSPHADSLLYRAFRHLAFYCTRFSRVATNVISDLIVVWLNDWFPRTPAYSLLLLSTTCSNSVYACVCSYSRVTQNMSGYLNRKYCLYIHCDIENSWTPLATLSTRTKYTRQ